MPKFVVRSDGEAWRALASELEKASALVRGADVNLNDLAKSLASIAIAVRRVFVDAGLASVRMDAAVKALDLRTKKSELERFARSDE